MHGDLKLLRILLAIVVFILVLACINYINLTTARASLRVREVGMRKVAGSLKSRLIAQFLVESASLCFIGAIIAFLACSVLIYLVSTFLPEAVPELAFLPNFMPMNLLVISTIVSVVVGVFAGLIPAFRASNLNPVDALRYE